MENKKRVGTDFSGVGAFDQALIRLGVNYEKVFACDYNYFARKTYILNFGTEDDLVLANSKEHKMYCDGMEFIILGKDSELEKRILELTNSELNEKKQKSLEAKIEKLETELREFEKKCKKLSIYDKDLEVCKYNFAVDADVFACMFSFYYPFNVYDRQIPEESLDEYVTTPPCQSFSLAGKRLGKDDKRGILFFNSLEFIDKNRPRHFYFENVKGLLSDDKQDKKADYGRTFQEWVNYLGGKSINGVPTIFPYEDSVPYHIYFKVLNAKDYGVPQNRERIFIIGIRDDEDNNFNFPKEFPLQQRLKDILEPVVDEKYFLSDEMVTKLIKENGKEFINQDTQASRVHNLEEPFPVLCAGTHGYASGYIKEDKLLNRNKYNNYSESEISSTITAGGTAVGSNLPLVVTNEIIQLNDPIHSNDRIYSDEGISPTLNTMQGGNRQPFVQVSDGHQSKIIIDEEYKIGAIRGRNHENPKSRKSGLETVQMLEINQNGVSNALTTVQKDNVVIINSNTIKGFEVAEEGDSIVYDMPNSKTRRGRVGKGVSQTIDTSCDIGVFTKQRIRRLTPTECFRLMNFNPEMIEKTISSGLISDSQLYKQAGNSVVVQHFVDLYSKLNLK